MDVIYLVRVHMVCERVNTSFMCVGGCTLSLVLHTGGNCRPLSCISSQIDDSGDTCGGPDHLIALI